MTVTRTKGDTTTERIVAAVEGLVGVEGKVGWFDTARYKDGTPVAYVATIHEFGTSRIPARPFMRPAVAEYGPQWVQLIGDGAKAVLRGSVGARDALEMVMLRAAGDVGKSITAVSGPPLAPQTVKRKGFDTLLVDTGQMIQSVTGKVEDA